MTRLFTITSKARTLTERLQESIAMLEAGQVVPKHKLPSDRDLEITHAELDRLLHPEVFICTNEDIKQAAEEILT